MTPEDRRPHRDRVIDLLVLGTVALALVALECALIA